MINKTISFELTDEEYGQLKQSVSDLDAQPGFSVNLTVEERRNLQVMSDRAMAFVEKALEYAAEQPGLMPPSPDAAKIQNHPEPARQMNELLLTELRWGVGQDKPKHKRFTGETSTIK